VKRETAGSVGEKKKRSSYRREAVHTVGDQREGWGLGENVASPAGGKATNFNK